MTTLPRSFYSQNTLIVARQLLGKIFVRRSGKELLTGMIVETEAYLFDDPASHSFRGMTERTKVMFGPPGHLYVYFTYGMHYCANVVTNKEGIGEAVLIRAVEPGVGSEKMAARRGKKNAGLRQKELTNGPAKFAQAFGLTTEHSGIDLTDGNITISDNGPVNPSRIITSTRIGITRAAEQPFRFYLDGNPFVSRR